MLVAKAAKAIGETECSRAQPHAERIREPFSEEINTGLAPMPDVGADVEKFVGRDWLEKPFTKSPAYPGSHSRQSESDDANEGAPIAEIELEGNVALKRCRVGRVMDEHRAIPACEKKRLADLRSKSLPARFAWMSARNRRRQYWGIKNRDRRVHGEDREIRNGIRFPEIVWAGSDDPSAPGLIPSA
jgi:hypothetical protein